MDKNCFMHMPAPWGSLPTAAQLLLWLFFALVSLNPQAWAQYVLETEAIYGKEVHRNRISVFPGKNAHIAKKTSFNRYVRADIRLSEQSGKAKVDYSFELSGSSDGGPALQLNSALIMPPGRRLLVARGKDWGLHFKLIDTDERLTRKAGDYGNLYLDLNLETISSTEAIKAAVLPKGRFEVICNAGENSKTFIQLFPADIVGGALSLKYYMNITRADEKVSGSGETLPLMLREATPVAYGDNWKLSGSYARY
ncbi:MAG: hypothetical protein PHV33_07480 [Elusimicrobiales bacterium]|nr:hypothetical protein [Elusimicrobiales bacterium]